MDKEALGRRIRDRRKVVALNQTVLAGKVGVSQGTVSDYERGRFDSPAAEIILKIAIALKVDPVWLFFGDGYPSASTAQMEDEANLLSLFRHLDARGRAQVLGAARIAVESQPEPSVADPFKTAGRVVEGKLIPAPRKLHSPTTKYSAKGKRT